MAVQILSVLTQALAAGVIVTVEKTKAIQQGGKQTITVGLDRTAVPSPRHYAIHRYGRNVPVEQASSTCTSARDAAQWIIDFCGRRTAITSLRESINRGNYGPGVRSFVQQLNG